MRPLALACCLAVLALAGCGEDDEQAASPPGLADLTVTLDRDGEGGAAPAEARVECADEASAPVCRAVAALRPEDFAPVPRRTACTLQFGGPEVATVKGTLRGEPIDARFSKENGCEIGRWREVQPLLEAAS